MALMNFIENVRKTLTPNSDKVKSYDSNFIKLIDDNKFKVVNKVCEFSNPENYEVRYISLNDDYTVTVGWGISTSMGTLYFGAPNTYIECDNTRVTMIASDENDCYMLELSKPNGIPTVKVEIRVLGSKITMAYIVSEKDYFTLHDMLEQYYLFYYYAYASYCYKINNHGKEVSRLKITRYGSMIQLEGVTRDDDEVYALVSAKDHVEGLIWHNDKYHICCERGYERFNITVGTKRYYFPIVGIYADTKPADVLQAILIDSLDYNDVTDLKQSTWLPNFDNTTKNVRGINKSNYISEKPAYVPKGTIIDFSTLKNKH